MLLHLAAAATLAAAAPAPPSVCSLVAFDFQRDDDRTFFVASPALDTAQAGMGGVQLGMFPEAPRPGAPPRRPVHGQVAAVERTGGRDTAVVEAAFRALGAREAVLVPWEFDPGCRPAVWRGSSRWAPVGEPGFYVARLRPREHWAGTRPTFDVFFAGRYPVPGGAFFRASPQPAPALTAAEYFDLYSVLPSRRTPYAQREQAARTLWGWAGANPAVAGKPTAVAILAAVRNYYGWSEEGVRRMVAAGAAPPAAPTGAPAPSAPAPSTP